MRMTVDIVVILLDRRRGKAVGDRVVVDSWHVGCVGNKGWFVGE